jgi:hypothetical protein
MFPAIETTSQGAVVIVEVPRVKFIREIEHFREGSLLVITIPRSGGCIRISLFRGISSLPISMYLIG